jgi:hypothetical protein
MQVVNLQTSVVARQYWPTTGSNIGPVYAYYNTGLYWQHFSFSYVQLEKRLKQHVFSSRHETKVCVQSMNADR